MRQVILGSPGFASQPWFARGLVQGTPQEVVPGGLGGIQLALTKVKEGKPSAIKLCFQDY